jgi:hypothetical protein
MENKTTYMVQIFFSEREVVLTGLTSYSVEVIKLHFAAGEVSNYMTADQITRMVNYKLVTDIIIKKEENENGR